MSLTNLRFFEPLKEFQALKKSFQVVYSTGSKGLHNNIRRICILDSSFNPPTRGHLSLISKSLDYYAQREHISSENQYIVLMLSVNNADKLPKPAAFEHRLDMMALLADHIQKEMKVNVSVALTHHPKFVEKAEVIESWAKEFVGDLDNLKFSFLVGYDTLIRIFNPKYYVPITIGDALNGFMKLNDLFCLTRSDTEIVDPQGQFKYVQDIADGNTKLPTVWSEQIHLVENDPDMLTISSSEIRDGVKNCASEVLNSKLIDEVAAYIQKHRLYETSGSL